MLELNIPLNQIPSLELMFTRRLTPKLLLAILVLCKPVSGQPETQQRSYQCRHRSVEQVVSLLRPLIPESSGAAIVVDQRDNRFQLSGPDYVHTIAKRLVSEADKPRGRAVTKAVTTRVMKPYSVPAAIQPTFARQIAERVSDARLSRDVENDLVFVSATPEEHKQVARLYGAIGRARSSEIPVAKSTVAVQPEVSRVEFSERRLPSIASTPRLAPPPTPRGNQEATNNQSTWTQPQDARRRVQATPSRGSVPQSQAFPSAKSAESPLGQPAQPAGVDSVSPNAKLIQFVQVPAGNLPRLQRQILAIFDGRIELRQVSNRQFFLVRTVGKTSRRLELEFDDLRSGVLVGGNTRLVAQMAKLVALLTRDREGASFRSQVFHLRRENHGKLKQLINDGAQSPRYPGGSADAGAAVQRLPATAFADERVQPARFLFQETSDSNTDEATGLIRQFEGVEVESLPDLDVIILRGSDQDLDQLAEIVKQLERLSKETQAEVRVRPLRHAQSEAVAEIIDRVTEDLVSGRQGKVSVQPLVKPNSLLLIGWGDAIRAVEKLIEQLDQPVAPNAQSEVFRLRNASASEASQTLTTLFQNRNGLGTRIQTAIDERTNSLIVYAAPRDLVEIRQLVADLDRAKSESVNRARVFSRSARVGGRCGQDTAAGDRSGGRWRTAFGTARIANVRLRR